MRDKEIGYCPLCGGELEITKDWLSPQRECDNCGVEMSMEVWGHDPDFWHRE